MLFTCFFPLFPYPPIILKIRHLQRLLVLAAMLFLEGLAMADEDELLRDVPVVVSVSRLPQPLQDAPGAVTVMDRRMIRMSGARDVADLLRFVPGFSVSNSFESNAPQGSYHIKLADNNYNLQVLVDGRAVYSPVFSGGAGPGLQAVSLEDIERIEVHRGSNSASYGARAFLGTVNIITRHSTSTLGQTVQVGAGDRSIQDGLASLGWGDERATYRLTADQRADQNLQGASGPVRVSRLNFRGDIQLGAGDQLELRAGQSWVSAGAGFSDQLGNAPRTRGLDQAFAQLDYKHVLTARRDLAVQASRTQERVTDQFAYLDAASPYNGISIDFGAQGTTDHISAQHNWQPWDELRWVMGAELRRETMVSRPWFDSDATFTNDFSRWFTHVEWRFAPKWLLNAGGMLERSTLGGETVAPRAMINWQWAQGHTLRWGVAVANRPPSFIEKYAQVVYRKSGVADYVAYSPSGNLSNEQMLSRELGYLLQWPERKFEADLRVFDERMTNPITRLDNNPAGGQPGYYANVQSITGNGQTYSAINFTGAEYQLKWQPWRDATLRLNQSLFKSTEVPGGDVVDAKVFNKYRGKGGLMFMQSFASGLDFSLMYSEAEAAQYPGSSALKPAMSRTDLRLAKSFKWAQQKHELAFTVHNMGPAYTDFLPSQYFQQQAFLTYRIED